MDAVDAGVQNMGEIGRRTILPSSFIGSPRYMQQCYQDAMAIVRVMGKPSVFVTFTCNPGWPEIKAELKNDQTAVSRPDLTARVFNMKLKVHPWHGHLLHVLEAQPVAHHVCTHVPCSAEHNPQELKPAAMSCRS